MENFVICGDKRHFWSLALPCLALKVLSKYSCSDIPTMPLYRLQLDGKMIFAGIKGEKRKAERGFL